ncbi:magnetosome protein MamE-Cter [Candidatus Desulfarcum epimagneticum]|uniref:Magnetosome protein MamE-Cter n=1 Tax=uncultured Desulfobacteraceae bacterium TaxID=218296 RepID=A0A484HMI2_9BACT|nr:magnetosome protein MamE-Cter [uncultured Desulfobacteraceae bacterium]
MKKIPHFEVFLAPVTVLAFAGLLSLMYGWVGTMNSLGQETRETPEAPETRIVAMNTQANPIPESIAINTGIGNGQMRLLDVNAPAVPMGVGGAAGQMRFVANQPAPRPEGLSINTGIGNTRMSLRDVNTAFPSGIGGAQGQIFLADTPPFSSGVGGTRGQIQFINNAATAPRPYLGLEVSAINGAMARQMGLPTGVGVYVKSAIPGSPARKAGFSKGDILIKCDLKNVGSLDQLSKIISLRKPGDVIKCVVLTHNGRKKSFHAKLADGPTGFRQVAAARVNQKLWIGMEVQNIDAVMRRQMSLPKKGGVIVSYLNAHSPAGRAGIKVGDVVRRVNGVHIKEAEQFKATVAKALTGKPLELVLLRGGKTARVRLNPGPRPAVTQTIPKVPAAEMVVEGSWIGMDVSELKPGETAEFGLPAGSRGIVVNDVESPPATTVGFQTGDLITAVNSTPTPTMKTFVLATKGQSGAVVDILRGNRHMYITVPPPGFTQQGTPVKQGQNNPLKQVAAVMPGPHVVGVLSDQNSLRGNVSDESRARYLILFDPQNNRHTSVKVVPGEQIREVLSRHRATTLIVAGIGNRAKNSLTGHRLKVYSGVLGNVVEAFQLYQAGRLVAAR